MTLCFLSKVLAQCSEPTWQKDDQIQLTVKPDASISFDDLRKLQEEEIVVQIADADRQLQFAKDNAGGVPANVSFTLTVPRRVKNTVVARNLADLISIDSATEQTPRAYYLIKEEEKEKAFCFVGALDEAPDRVRRYHEAIRLWQCLADNADHKTASGSLLFFGVKRTEIKPGFGLNELAEDIKVERVEQFLNNQEKPDIRKEIFKSVVLELLRDQRADKAFSYLLRSGDLFAQRLNEGWTIYLFDYSPAKLNEEAVAKHLELTEKLEKIISGMEAKSLTIPAAVLLAVKEVQLGAHWTTLNTMILTASVLYFLAMTVAHFSQRSTLKLLERTIAKTRSDFEAQGLAQDNPVLKDSFTNLESRRKISSWGSWAMLFFSLVPLIAVCYAAFWASPPPPKPTTSTGQLIVTCPPLIVSRQFFDS